MIKRTTMRTGARAVRNGSRAAAMAAEVPAAALITISHRLPMIFAAAIEPEARNNPELKRMVTEKAKAAVQSADALSRGATRAGDAFSRHWQEQSRLSARLAASPPAGDPASACRLIWHQAQLNFGASAAFAATLADLATSTTAQALSPAHKKVAANAKRLSAGKKRPVARQRRTGKH